MKNDKKKVIPQQMVIISSVVSSELRVSALYKYSRNVTDFVIGAKFIGGRTLS